MIFKFNNRLSRSFTPMIFSCINMPRTSSFSSLEDYKSDPKVLTAWLDVSIIKRNGKAFQTDISLIPVEEALIFPDVRVFTLIDTEAKFPTDVPGLQGVKLISFSISRYGFNLLRGWLDPFRERFQNNNEEIPSIEICFVEHSFLSWARSVFLSNLKTEISCCHYATTGLCFGGVWDFASSLRIPNKYTGYIFLLDSNNRIRWRACGSASTTDTDLLIKMTNALIDENKNKDYAKR
mmetsp:Transcript_19694/g.19794  ORF Transcript_19694/g.19794 Transcript_19694/m.19794 type:complete len:236 (+) Transcript_19694:178-885(+)